MYSRRSTIRSSLLTGLSVASGFWRSVPAASTGLDREIAQLRSRLAGIVITPGEFAYEALRRPRGGFNPRTDKRPLLIAECGVQADVSECLAFALRHDLPISIRGGGHSFTGLSANEGGMLLDVRRMRHVEIDAQNRIATVGGGALTLEVAAHAGVHGLAPVLAECPMVGVAGLALGGGLSALSGKHGATCDTIRSFDIIVPDGRLLKASASSNPDLFWALRGGGGNFGIVTSTTLELFPQPHLTYGDISYRSQDTGRMLRFFRDFMRNAPDALQAVAAVRNVGGDLTLNLRMFWSGGEEGDRVFSAFRSAARPVNDTITTGSFTDAFHLYGIGGSASTYSAMSGAYIADLTDEAIDTVLEQLGKAGVWSPAFIGLDHYMHGQACRIPAGETAFDVRNPGGLYVWISRSWDGDAQHDDAYQWLDETWHALRRFSRDRAYTNYPTLTGTPAAEDAYPASLERLREVKRRYDPDNIFRSSVNIQPG